MKPCASQSPRHVSNSTSAFAAASRRARGSGAPWARASQFSPASTWQRSSSSARPARSAARSAAASSSAASSPRPSRASARARAAPADDDVDVALVGEGPAQGPAGDVGAGRPVARGLQPFEIRVLVAAVVGAPRGALGLVDGPGRLVVRAVARRRQRRRVGARGGLEGAEVALEEVVVRRVRIPPAPLEAARRGAAVQGVAAAPADGPGPPQLLARVEGRAGRAPAERGDGERLGPLEAARDVVLPRQQAVEREAEALDGPAELLRGLLVEDLGEAPQRLVRVVLGLAGVGLRVRVVARLHEARVAVLEVLEGRGAADLARDVERERVLRREVGPEPARGREAFLRALELRERGGRGGHRRLEARQVVGEAPLQVHQGDANHL